MTSSLPNFVPTAAPAAGVSCTAPVAGFGPAPEVGLDGTSAAPASEFASFLPAAPASGNPTACAPGSGTAVAVSAPAEGLAFSASRLSPVTGNRTGVLSGPRRLGLPARDQSSATASVAMLVNLNPVRLTLPEAAVVSGNPAVDTNLDVASPEISPAALENASAFVATLLQSLLPVSQPIETGPVSEAATADLTAPSHLEAQAPGDAASLAQLSAPAGARLPPALTLPDQSAAAGHSIPEWGQPEQSAALADSQALGSEVQPQDELAVALLPNSRVFTGKAFAHATPSLGAHRAVPAGLPDQARPISGEQQPVRVPSSADQATMAGPISYPVESALQMTFAADGAIECTIELPPRSASFSDQDGTNGLELQAELELPGQAVVRVTTQQADIAATAPQMKEVIFAGRTNADLHRQNSAAAENEKHFVNSGDKQLKADSASSGIAVANSDATMPFAPKEKIQMSRHTGSLSVTNAGQDFAVMQTTSERLAAAPAEKLVHNLAERAVATVTNLGDAQFSASMQKSGSVQLRLRFGEQDLSVKVELRAGVVHTDFRTDSPELREAVMREWQALASETPARMQRYLDPVFSPSTNATTADSGAQQQSFHRPSQQSGQEQPGARNPDWSSASPFSRRSQLSDNFVPEPAAPRAPVRLPTSLRLSVLA